LRFLWVAQILFLWAGTVFGGQVSVAAVGVATAAVRRPTWRVSEIDVGQTLPSGARYNVSYLNGVEVRYGMPDSVRPDWVVGNTSVEVKNYSIATNSESLVAIVSDQAIARAQHLPQGMSQRVVIDVRGQTVTPQQEARIVQDIVQRSRGTLAASDIFFFR
jgi:filamentous hemagglutinin